MVFHYNQVGIKTDPFTEDTDGDYISDLDEVKPNSVLNKIYDNLDPVKENWVGYFVMGYNLYDEIKFDSSSDDGLNTYCDHVRKYNEVKTRIIVKDWSAPNYLKYRLQTEFDNGLIGAVFVGHAPTAFWEDTDDNDYGGSHPCDWYYQDLDGSWEDVWAPHSSQLLVQFFIF